jgi:hypothetical protein
MPFLPALDSLNFLTHLSGGQVRVMLDIEHCIKSLHVHIPVHS